MANWIDGGGIKVERAKEHIRDLEVEIADFLKSDPYTVTSEDDVEAGQVVCRIHVAQHPPPRWGAIAGDAAHDLRSALDYLWRNVWYPDGGGLTDFRCTFPIFKTAHALEARFRSVVKGRKKAAVDLVQAIKPYQGGNDDLWRLDRINTVDKHRLLIPAYARIGVTTIDGTGGMRALFPDMVPADFPSMRIGINWADPLCPVTDGAEVFRCPIKDRTYAMGMNPQFPLEIAFGEGEMIKGQPIVPTLNASANMVEEVAAQFMAANLLV